MSDRRPEPGSPWARHCPDAWPREWLDRGGMLPQGFSRAADSSEADLIVGRITETAFLRSRAGRRANGTRARTPSLAPPARSKGKGNPVVAKVLGYRRFFDAILTRQPRLSPGAVSVWCWLWTCAKKGRARCSVRKLAARFRVSKSTAARWLAELVRAGFVRIEERGQIGESATLVRVRASAPHAARYCPAGGTVASR